MNSTQRLNAGALALVRLQKPTVVPTIVAVLTHSFTCSDAFTAPPPNSNNTYLSTTARSSPLFPCASSFGRPAFTPPGVSP